MATHTHTQTHTYPRSPEDLMHIFPHDTLTKATVFPLLAQSRSLRPPQKMPKSIRCADLRSRSHLVLQSYINAECKVASELRCWHRRWRGKVWTVRFLSVEANTAANFILHNQRKRRSERLRLSESGLPWEEPNERRQQSSELFTDRAALFCLLNTLHPLW